MNVLMFTNTYLPHVGGVARSVSGFVEDLRRAGHGVLVVAPTFKGADTTSDNVIRVPAIQNFNGSDFSVRIPIPGLLDSKIDEFQPDLVHSHHPFLLGDTAMRSARQRALPLVFTHHTLYERYTHYVPFNAEGMKRFAIELSTQYANLCDLVLTPSESVRELLDSRGVTSPMTVLPTGVDVDRFRQGRQETVRSELGIPVSAPVVGHVGRLAKEKNLDFLTDAVCLVLKQRADAWFLVVGDGSYRESMENAAREAGVADRFAALGTRSGQELIDAYAALDLFAFASTSETQGLVVAEAMAAAKPVVALDASGVRDVVQNQVNGRLLATSVSPEEFSDAIMDGLDRVCDADGCDWIENALKTADRFSRKRSRERLEDAYQDAIRKRSQHANSSPPDTWDRLLNGIRAEWDLILSKGAAAWVASTES